MKIIKLSTCHVSAKFLGILFHGEETIVTPLVAAGCGRTGRYARRRFDRQVALLLQRGRAMLCVRQYLASTK